MIKLILILLMPILLYSRIVFAGCEEGEHLKQEAAELIQFAIDLGINHIDGNNLEKMKSDISDVCVTYMKGIRAKVGTRLGGIYQKFPGQQKGSVSLYANYIKPMPKEFRSGLVLHELLGANEYDDQNFNITMQLFSLKLQEKDSESLAKVREKRNSEKLSFQIAGGSGTSIGGGGDPSILNVKGAAILRIMKLMENIKNSSYSENTLIQMFEMTLDCDFEPSNGGHLANIKPSIRVFKNRNYGTEGESTQLIEAAWFVVEYHPLWLSKNDITQVGDIILNAMYENIKLNPEVKYCQPPGKKWQMLMDRVPPGLFTIQ